jgi:hypothetical protein
MRAPTLTITFDRAERQAGAKCIQKGNRRRRLRGTTAILGTLLAFSFWVLVPQSWAAAGTGAKVLSPSATPNGYSRADMTRLLALFTTSNNQQQYYPNTPFQILYVDPTLVQASFVTSNHTPCDPPGPECGLFFTQSGAFANSFDVSSGRSFFVPVDNADDSPPVVGVFPTSPKTAKVYVFDPSQLGGRDFSVSIDLRSTPLGPDYVAGPVETPPLLDGGGTHMITLGAFLSPMSPGTHIVEIKGGYFGAGIQQTYGFGFVSFDFTYRIQVGDS